ncbi:hypothetical protein [Brucella sp. IR073]|uniref:hypothetical protein n=1 Tax=unclassified Brucella TaxID=2632610 RepID=UPI003B9809BB
MEKMPSLDKEFGKFPPHMLGVRDVFEFSYASADRVAKRFRNNSDIIRALDGVLQIIIQSSLSDSDKQILDRLLADEKDVVSFAQTSRNSVIAL